MSELELQLLVLAFKDFVKNIVQTKDANSGGPGGPPGPLGLAIA
jgi:hypothetical protein